MHSNDRLVTGEVLEKLRRLEEELWQPNTRFDDEYMDKVFAPDFFEYGRSGRRYRRNEMFLRSQGLTEIRAELPLKNFSVRYLTDDVVQVTYISKVEHDGEVLFGNRSSVWTKIEGEWRLRFHQGTPCDPV